MVIATPAYLVRQMTMDDVPRVMEIERQSFPAGWPQTLYQRELQQNRQARYLVVERSPDDERSAPAEPPRWLRLARRLAGGAPPAAGRPMIVGFIGVWFMAGESHVVTIAVDPNHRRRGIGELLILSSIDLSLAHDQGFMSLECRVSNTGAQALYEKYGFHRTGVRPRYYSDDGEDAVIMTTESLTSERYRARLIELRRRHEGRWGRAARSGDALR